MLNHKLINISCYNMLNHILINMSCYNMFQGQATVMLVAAGLKGPQADLPAKVQFNLLCNNLTCCIT